MQGSKLSGRVVSIFQEWPGEPHTIAKEKVLGILADEVGDSGSKLLMSDINASLLTVLKAFPDKNNPFFTSLNEKEDLLRVGVRIALNPDCSEIELFVGFGASLIGPTVRLPAYVLPVVSFLNAFVVLQKQGVINSLPRVCLLWVDNSGSICNGYSSAEVHKCGEKSRAYLKAFLKEFFPEIAPQFSCVTDVDWSTDEDLIRFIDNMAQQLDCFSGNGGVGTAINRVKSMGYKHGGNQGVKNALRYAVLHSVYNGDVVSEFTSRFLPSGFNRSPKTIVSFGCRAEKTFYLIRGFIKERLEQEFDIGFSFPCTIQSFSSIGKNCPPYYPDPDGDLMLSDVDSAGVDKGLDLGETAKKDLRTLRMNIAGFDGFVANYSNNVRG